MIFFVGLTAFLGTVVFLREPKEGGPVTFFVAPKIRELYCFLSFTAFLWTVVFFW